MAYVHLGFFENFKSDNTLLLAGDKEGLILLSETFKSLSVKNAQPIAFHSLPFVKAHHNIELLGSHSLVNSGISRSGNIFNWQRSDEGWNDGAEKILVVSKSSHGHHYLDTSQDKVTVMVSLGEYSDKWWITHG